MKRFLETGHSYFTKKKSITLLYISAHHHSSKQTNNTNTSLFSCAPNGNYSVIFMCIIRNFPSLPSFSLSQSSHKFSSRRLLRSSTQRNKIQQYLVPHNIVGAKVGLPPLKWSKKLANFASWGANQQRRDCDLVHSNSNHGESLLWGSAKNWKSADAVAAWAAEKGYYNHKSNSCTDTKIACIILRWFGDRAWKLVVCKSGDTFCHL